MVGLCGGICGVAMVRYIVPFLSLSFSSRSLGESKSFLELNCKSLPAAEIAELQELVNIAILECRPMVPRLLEPGSEELTKVRSCTFVSVGKNCWWLIFNVW